jgi:hypothetical protein
LYFSSEVVVPILKLDVLEKVVDMKAKQAVSTGE